MRVTKIYEDNIRRAFSAHAGDEQPDPEAIREVQRAVAVFVKNIVTQAHERSHERDPQGDRIYVEDLLYLFKDNPKYIHACAKTLVMSQSMSAVLKKAMPKTKLGANVEESQEEFSSNELESLQKADN